MLHSDEPRRPDSDEHVEFTPALDFHALPYAILPWLPGAASSTVCLNQSTLTSINGLIERKETFQPQISTGILLMKRSTPTIILQTEIDTIVHSRKIF
jgi:hypothetical protein